MSDNILAEPQINTNQDSVESKTNNLESYTISLNGERPYTEALNIFKHNILSHSISNALQKLITYPQYTYASVPLKLFAQIEIPCKNQEGVSIIKKYYIHELHYGPMRRPYNKDKMASTFFDRDISIWTRVNAYGKMSGGDGTGKNGTACSPFRDWQLFLRDRGLYLIDASDIVYDMKTCKFHLKISITIYRQPPKEPCRAPHGYGFIPGLGSAIKPDTDLDNNLIADQ